jgi:hypothetical protein
MTGQQKEGATKDPNGLNSYVHKSKYTFCGSIEN